MDALQNYYYYYCYYFRTDDKAKLDADSWIIMWIDPTNSKVETSTYTVGILCVTIQYQIQCQSHLSRNDKENLNKQT